MCLLCKQQSASYNTPLCMSCLLDIAREERTEGKTFEEILEDRLEERLLDNLESSL